MDTAAIRAAVQSHAMASGLFENVDGHEPDNAPTNGLSAAIFARRMGPATGSSLAATTARLELNIRIVLNINTQPEDDIDPVIMGAADALMTAYSGDFELGGNVKAVDLLGMAGAPLGWEAGYLPQDGGLFRMILITLPILINDAWPQVA